MEIALSSTKSKYTGLSYALREAIPLMVLLKEMGRNKFKILSDVAEVHCKVFEDNSGAVAIATVHKVCPRTKHFNFGLHHFRDHVNQGKITIHHMSTDDMPADILTKPVNEDKLKKHRKFIIMGWTSLLSTVLHSVPLARGSVQITDPVSTKSGAEDALTDALTITDQRRIASHTACHTCASSRTSTS
jgi:hypothetical protein